MQAGQVHTMRVNMNKRRYLWQGLLLTVLSAMPNAGVAQSATTADHSAKTASVGKTAKTITIHLDPEATIVRWTLKSLLHNAHGTFRLKGGDVVINPETGLAQGEVLIDAGSGSSGDTKRDAAWQKDILDSATYPAIIFHPVKVEGLKSTDGTSQVKASGTLTLKGQDHPIEMMLFVTTSGKDASLTAHFTIPYVEWGLKDAGSGITRYGKQIDINVAGKGALKNELAIRAAPPAPDAK